MGEKVLFAIDAGHHDKYNQGIIKSYYEGNAMWTLAGFLIEELKKFKDIEVINTRKSINEKPNAYQRGADVAQMTGYDKIIYLTLHTNASGGGAAGVATFRSIYKPDNQALGDKLAKAITDVMKPKTKVTYSWGCLAWENKDYKGYDKHDNMRGIMLNAGSKEAAKLTNITYGLIIEHGFHDNKIECEFLLDNNNLKAIAEAEAKVLRDYFALKLKNPPATPVAPVTPIEPAKPSTSTISVGDVVELASNAVYYNGATIPQSIKAKKWIVYSIAGSKVIIDKSEDKKMSIYSAVDIKYLKKNGSTVVETTKPTPTPTPAPAPTPTPAPVDNTKIEVNSIVSILPNAVYYNTTKLIPDSVRAKKWIVKSVSGSRVVVDKSTDGKMSICSAVDIKYLKK